jgi:tyrosyl-DNA phosphodiesterase 2
MLIGVIKAYPPLFTRRLAQVRKRGPPALLMACRDGEVIVLTGSSDDEIAERTPKRAREEAAAVPPLGGGDNSFLAQLHADRLARRGVPPPVDTGVPLPAASPALSELRLLTYNVWFENVAQEARMASIGRSISARAPHVVCLQEVTPQLERMLRAGAWSRDYALSPSPATSYYSLLAIRLPLGRSVTFKRTEFRNSRQGRDVTHALLQLGGGARVCVATSHLESWLGPGDTGAAVRSAQLQAALSQLGCAGADDVLYAGDLNWDDSEQGLLASALPSGWEDVWSALRPREPGYTYDCVANAMLVGRLQKRLDRVIARTARLQLAEIKMIGEDTLPGVTYVKEFRGGGSKQLCARIPGKALFNVLADLPYTSQAGH